ncbi:MAG: electron transfer flavoprotein subunit alpha [Flavobacteriales bacterium]|jgi:electron transfer flavoprotein alpha subunit|nr:electron transfer flavoprotein subunit alpha [Flavobacteriales bacterium]|tara:strand:+ start:16082 stop:17026 length:945 start_codon:yes stop_codon:yes gene_type:complete
MSILVYTESWEGKFRKSTFEAVSYASEVAKMLSTNVIAVSFGEESEEELAKLGNYGAEKVFACNKIEKGDSETTSNFLAENSVDANIIVFASTNTSKMIASRLSAKIKAGVVSNAIELPLEVSPVTLKRKSFSSKAIEKVKVNSDKAIICLASNSFGVIENKKSCNIDKRTISISENIRCKGQEITTGKVSLTEAEIIVSAGRGLKGPENWKMIEDLAGLLGAATACSKPVSDIGWRPHDEHVGQTGKAVSPNLYFAIGISGAIQHLAGVNSSKVMVVINTDPEAPFFKSADYGIVGDAFEVVPKLIEEIKKIK